MNRADTRIKSLVIFIVMVFVYVFAFTDRFMIICLGITFVCFLASGARPTFQSGSLERLLVLMAILPIACMVYLAFPFFSGIASWGIIRKEIIRAILYLLILATTSNLEVDAKHYTRVWNAVLFVVVGIAVLQYVKIFDITSVLRNIYGDTRQFYNTQFSDLSTFRCGSVFLNPNVLASYLVAALVPILVVSEEYRFRPIKKAIPVGMVVIGVVLTGSRTGLLATLAIIAVFLWEESNHQLSSFFLRLIILSALTGIVLLIFRNSLGELLSMRLFSITEGRQDSLAIKLEHYFTLIKNMNILNIIIGYGPYDYTSNINLEVDFDLGYLTTYYGAIGLGVFFSFLRRIKNYGKTDLKARKTLNRGFMAVYFIFSLTAGVYFNIRIFGIYLLLFLPMIFHEGEQLA